MAAPTLEEKGRELEREAALLARRVQLASPHDDMASINREAGELRKRIADYTLERMVENRPEVVSRGRADTHLAAQAGLAEARARLEARVAGGASTCPAAAMFAPAEGGVGVRCGIELSVLSSRTDPQSLLTFCFGSHEACPTWVAEKERIAAGKGELVSAAEGA